MSSPASNAAALETEPLGNGRGKRVRLSGKWRNVGLPPELKALDTLGSSLTGDALEIDFSDVHLIDTSGAWVLKNLATSVAARGTRVEMTGMSPEISGLMEALPDRLPQPAASPADKRSLFQIVFEPVGRAVYDFWQDSISAMNILGAAVRGAQLKFGRGSGLSPAAVINQMDNMGVRAVPIITLMSFLIGAIIAQQGAFQLRYFGAEIFVVDLVGILQLREVGVLLTAIMIAGRSGSAITAEIGSMKMNEEVDALLVMGLNPVGVLIFPRLAALAVVLPLLTIVANFAALFGAAVVALAYSGITFEVFLERLHQAVAFSTIIAGMVKAPFMALVIGVVAAVEGLKVGGSAESLGKQVTASVVKSIFVVILMDGLFAMFYASIGF